VEINSFPDKSDKPFCSYFYHEFVDLFRIINSPFLFYLFFILFNRFLVSLSLLLASTSWLYSVNTIHDLSSSNNMNKDTPKHTLACSKCTKPLGEQLVRALDGAFHPECFTCWVSTWSTQTKVIV
jgi:hypothetical protein